MNDDLPPPLESVKPLAPTASPQTVSGVKKGFLLGKPLSVTQPNQSPVSLKDLKHSSLHPDVIQGVHAIIRQHYVAPRVPDNCTSPALIATPTRPEADFAEVLGVILSDPSRANQILSQNPEASANIRGLLGKLGNYFEGLSQTEQIKESPTPQSVSDDPEIRHLISMIQKGAKIDPRAIAQSNPRLAKKIDTLLKQGHLKLIN
jgi:hypothetical protein